MERAREDRGCEGGVGLELEVEAGGWVIMSVCGDGFGLNTPVSTAGGSRNRYGSVFRKDGGA